jgi:metal-responsive CopG/Arc/MetJ family transcriptional regulator
MSTETRTVKVIQVSMPQPLLEAVTHCAKAQKESRAAFIRRALERYLAELREQEEVSIGETGAKLAAMVFSEEEW